MLKFQLYTFVGSWPWCFGLAYIGFVLGKNWDTNPALRIRRIGSIIYRDCHHIGSSLVLVGTRIRKTPS